MNFNCRPALVISANAVIVEAEALKRFFRRLLAVTETCRLKRPEDGIKTKLWQMKWGLEWRSSGIFFLQAKTEASKKPTCIIQDHWRGCAQIRRIIYMSNTRSSKLKPVLRTLSSSVTVDYSEHVTAQSVLKLFHETRSFNHFIS